MKMNMETVIPNTANSDYRGSRISMWVFTLIAIVSTIRSLIHIFAPDGGASSIAGMDLSKGSENIVFVFGLWGISQLIYAILQLLVAFRFRTLIPLFYIILLFETVGRMALGRLKPPILLHGTPPGGIADFVILPLAVVMLVLSIRARKKQLPSMDSKNISKRID